MNILFLDDELDRHSKVELIYPNEQIIHAHTVDEGLNILPNFDFDIISIDHDLSNKPYTNNIFCNVDCGCNLIAKIIKIRYQFKNTKFILHSFNNEAAFQMYQDLIEYKLNAEITPFKY